MVFSFLHEEGGPDDLGGQLLELLQDIRVVRRIEIQR
jgi:hypothetical protein